MTFAPLVMSATREMGRESSRFRTDNKETDYRRETKYCVAGAGIRKKIISLAAMTSIGMCISFTSLSRKKTQSIKESRFLNYIL